MSNNLPVHDRWNVHFIKPVWGIPEGDHTTLCGLSYAEINFSDFETDAKSFLERASHGAACSQCHRLLSKETT